MKTFFTLCSLLLLTACISSGVRVTENNLETFKKGKTTYNDVVAVLGFPTQMRNTSDGKMMAIYSYVSMQTRPESFIPIVGIFAGGVDTENSSAIFNFDQYDVLIDYSVSSGAMGGGRGLEGVPQHRNSDQPRAVR